MKNIFTLLLALLSVTTALGNSTTATLPITKVVVYQKGAQVTHHGPVSLRTGEHVIEFGGITDDIQQHTLRTSLGKATTIISVTVLQDTWRDMDAVASIDSLHAVVDLHSDSIALLSSYLNIYQAEKKMIIGNSSIKGTAGLTAADVKSYSDFYRDRMIEIEQLMLALKYQKAALQKKVLAAQRQITSLTAHNVDNKAKIQIVYSSEKDDTVEASLSYLVNEAGWTPNYDVRVTTVAEPLAWDYKAKVYQQTGVVWADVELAFATGYPSTNLSRPKLSTYYLTPHNYYTRKPQPKKQLSEHFIQGKVTDVNNEPLIGASIMHAGNSSGTITDIDGTFNLKLEGESKQIQVSYTGFDSKVHTAHDGFNTIVLEEGKLLEEIVTVEGNRSRSLRASVAGITSEGYRGHKTEKQIPLSITKNVTQRIFNLDIPYTIKSEAKQRAITLLTYQIDADYSYEIVPKIEDKAYLVASIADWHQYELLSGQIHIYFNGVYQGKHKLDLSKTSDKITLGVGIDPNLQIKRIARTDYRDGNFIGTKVTSKKIWDTEIYNGHDHEVTVKVTDQVPVSKSDRIDVEVKDIKGGKLNEDTGIVTWEETIASRFKTVFTVEYNVKAKKSDKVIVE